jgi:hypothetical protein
MKADMSEIIMFGMISVNDALVLLLNADLPSLAAAVSFPGPDPACGWHNRAPDRDLPDSQGENT